jgi:hypothetical protein
MFEQLSEGAEVSWRVCKNILKFWPQPTVPHLDMVDEEFPPFGATTLRKTTITRKAFCWILLN